MVPNDTMMAFSIGLALGTVIIVALRIFPGEPFDYEFEEGTANDLKQQQHERQVRATEINDGATQRRGMYGGTASSLQQRPGNRHLQKLVVDSKKLDCKSRQAERSIGIPRAIFKEAVLQATAEQNSRLQCGDENIEAEDNYPSGDISRTFVLLVLLVAIAIAAVAYGNRHLWSACPPYILHTLARIFPREARALGYDNTI